jgi:hypothetical protein
MIQPAAHDTNEKEGIKAALNGFFHSIWYFLKALIADVIV